MNATLEIVPSAEGYRRVTFAVRPPSRMSHSVRGHGGDQQGFIIGDRKHDGTVREGFPSAAPSPRKWRPPSVDLIA